mmetsp:Transcript_18421/g.46418  ORF Transcript_18421/g.46418 Transcript_18421/m.46418 type:complete len:245 (-) Transcript_18421:522-1256(-)
MLPLLFLSRLSSFHRCTTPSGVCGLLPASPITPSSKEPRSPGDPGQLPPPPPASPPFPIPHMSPLPAQLRFHSLTISALDRTLPASGSAAATARSLPALAGLALPPDEGPALWARAPTSHAPPSRSPKLGAFRYLATSSGIVARALVDSMSISASGDGDGDAEGPDLESTGGAAPVSAAGRELDADREAGGALDARRGSLGAVGKETGARVCLLLGSKVGGGAPHADSDDRGRPGPAATLDGLV